MKMKYLAILLLSVAASRAGRTMAAELGDPAPALQIAQWIKGGPVDLAAVKGKSVVVVEFWATWCPPCRATIPHLTELQKKFKGKGVVFAGLSDETLARVKPFVEQMGEKMNYAVALDDGRKTSEGYLQAFGVNGIPHAFIVDKEGRIVWHGHPMGGLDKALEQLLSGKFDLAVEKKRAAARGKVSEFLQLASEGGSEERLDKLGGEIQALDKELGGIEPGEKFNPAEIKQALKMQRLFNDYYRAVTGDAEAATVRELAGKLAAAESKNVEMLNEIAWALLTDDRIKIRDLKLAMKFAQAALAACDSKDASVLETYARALFDTGQVKDAIKYQQQAIALCKDGEQKAELEKSLKRYREKAAGK
jgi:thiol-disulfide isomerase/thioredoxin